MIFENMGITYLGPVDGHNLMDLVRILREAKKVNGAVVVHVQTEKGRGYQPAEEHPDRFHGTGPFDIPSGQPLVKKEKPNYTDVFSTVITKIAAKDDRSGCNHSSYGGRYRAEAVSGGISGALF